MKKLWTDPANIHVVEVLNNRELNSDYIGSLAESMELNGYLVDYPIDVFEAAKIPSIQTNKLYLCACGAHRTHAALLAEIDEVLCVIHNGDEEDWIEKMSLDNFQFDVAANSSIGQTFTKKEKRAACTQLLLLPKYLKMTNTALAESWNTSEGNVRRWRGEVSSLINEDSPQLRGFGVSPERVARLNAVLGKSERLNGNGEPVKIRQKSPEATEEEKSSLYRTIRTDAGDYAWGAKLKKTFLGKHDIQWEEVRTFISEKWNIDDEWDAYKDISMNQLRNLHNLILTEDPDLITRCQGLAQERNVLAAAKSDLYDACNLSEAKLHESFCPNQSTYSDRFRTVKEIFIRAAKVEGYTDFSFDSYDYSRKSGLEFLRLATTHHNEVSKAIEEKADWVEAVRTTIATEEAKTRAKIESDFRKAKQEMLDAFGAYPRNISLEAFCYGFDDHFHEKAGHCLRRIQQDIPTKNASNTSLECDAKNFRKAADNLAENTAWVKRIPEQKNNPPEATVPESKSLSEVLEGGALASITICWWGEADQLETAYFKEDRQVHPYSIMPRLLSDIPEELLVQLLEIARKGESS